MLELIMKNGESYDITGSFLTIKPEQVAVGSNFELTYLLFARSEKDKSIFRLKDIQLVKANDEVFNFNMGFREDTTEWVNDRKKIFELASSYEKNHKNMSCKELKDSSKSEEEGLNSKDEDFSDNTEEIKTEEVIEIEEDVTINGPENTNETLTSGNETIDVSFINCSKDQTLSFPKGIKIHEIFDSLFKSSSNPYKDMIVSDKYKFTKWAIITDDGEAMINTNDEIVLNENTTLKAHWKSLNKKH